MADIYIVEDYACLSKKGDKLNISKNKENMGSVPFHKVDSIHAFGNVQFSTQLLHELLNKNINLSLYTHSGNYIGQLISPTSKNIDLRFMQYKQYENEEFRLAIGKALIAQKFEASIRLLEDNVKNSETLSLKDELKQLRKWRKKLETAKDIPGLLGLEGSFARIYFECFGKLFKQENIFQGRSKKPPKDLGNSLLSFLYVVLTNRISSYLEGQGFEPFIGFLHARKYGRISLACDIIEPLRPAFCDRLVLKAFNLKTVSEEDFEKKEEGFYLNPEAKKAFLKLYSTELFEERQYLFHKGTIQDILIYFSDWLKTCLEKGEVIALSGK
ncbi:MAG: CRISPR-associated endonuclease Cas1 [Leptospiraceae bacterium]|nr:CRISPR-associated endonuclease Cas1 [Leptospiraceae bacterium]MCP5503232.1 CRISPR-associated endonuclease Cas1 [Leptospiraceae bacterium]